jgi:patatin-like phospholipase/acyl hydrolase
MQKPAFKILSIDGGGIRGIIPCTILEFIEKHTQRPIYQLFDLMAGTSTGGIITAGLCTPKQNANVPHTAAEMAQIYLTYGKTIFGKRQRNWLANVLSKINKTIGEMFNKNYDEAAIEQLLTEYFADKKLCDSLIDIIITTYDLQERKPFYFSSRLAKEADISNWLIREMVRSTSAAPTYFEPNIMTYKGKRLVTVDGGVFANNPAILAYGEAKELWKMRQSQLVADESAEKGRDYSAIVQASDSDVPFYMLSIGTGYHDKNETDLSHIEQWSTREWIKLLLTDVFMQSVAESTDYTMQHLLPLYTDGTARYQRFNVPLTNQQTAMDDAQNIPSLKKSTENYIEANREALLQVCEMLMANNPN